MVVIINIFAFILNVRGFELLCNIYFLRKLIYGFSPLFGVIRRRCHRILSKQKQFICYILYHDEGFLNFTNSLISKSIRLQ